MEALEAICKEHDGMEATIRAGISHAIQHSHKNHPVISALYVQYAFGHTAGDTITTRLELMTKCRGH